jgi:hypothetical protein
MIALRSTIPSSLSADKQANNVILPTPYRTRQSSDVGHAE